MSFVWDHYFKGTTWMIPNDVSHAYSSEDGRVACGGCSISNAIGLRNPDRFRKYPPEAPLCQECAAHTGIRERLGVRPR